MSFFKLSGSLDRKQQEELEQSQIQIELEPEEEQKETTPAPVNIFEQGVKVDKLKKYYKRLERNISLWIIFTEMFLIAATLLIAKEILELWGVQQTTSLWEGLKKFKDSGYTVQIPISIGAGLFLIWNLRNLNRLIFKRRVIVSEHHLCKSKYYPTSMTPALTSRILSLFSWRLNVFWLGFTLIFLGLIAVAGAHGYAGYKAAIGNWGMEWYKKWFESTKAKDWVALGGFFGMGGGGASIIFTNPILRFMIKKALDIFSLNEYNMGTELREKTFKINKRNKIACLIICCLAGLPFYIILKKLIIAVFHKSFKYSKR